MIRRQILQYLGIGCFLPFIILQKPKPITIKLYPKEPQPIENGFSCYYEILDGKDMCNFKKVDMLYGVPYSHNSSDKYIYEVHYGNYKGVFTSNYEVKEANNWIVVAHALRIIEQSISPSLEKAWKGMLVKS